MQEVDYFSPKELSKFNNSDFRSLCKKAFNLKTFEKNEFRQIINTLSEEIRSRLFNVGNYKEYFRIKSQNITRRTIEFDLKDFFLYLYLVFCLQDEIAINRVEHTYGGFRFDNKLKQKEGIDYNSLDILNYSTINKAGWVEAYGEFNSILLQELNTKKYNNVAGIDIANFYDNINLFLLEDKIKHSITKEKSPIVSLLFYFLKHWDKKHHFYNQRTMGIPQDVGGEASRLLSNFYLQDYDSYIYEKCKRYGVKYIRYSDDQIFLGKDESSLKIIVFLASKYLAKFHLNINSSKVFYKSIGEFQKERFSINYTPQNTRLSDEACIYKDLLNNEDIELTYFNRGLKRLINLIVKANRPYYRNFEFEAEDDKVYYDKVKIIDWICRSEYSFLSQINEKYQLEKLQKFSKIIEIESEIILILEKFIETSFDFVIINYIKDVFGSTQQKCTERLIFIHSLDI
jgi:hypothetical protein